MYRSRKRKYDFSNIDLYSDMYPSMERLQRYLDSNPDKPFLMCEYAHAMGNGPGDLEDYWQFIQDHDIMCGGFVWEWCDHAIYAGVAENGKAKYLYGGDHGEWPHDGNFCVDGLVYPDRTPGTGLMEYKNVHRPARIEAYDTKSGQVTIHNYMDFVALSDYVTATYEVNCDGAVLTSGKEADMKRLIALLAVLICMTMILPLTAFAGDIPESLLYEEGAQIFFGEVLSYHPDKEDPDIEVWPQAVIKGDVKIGWKQIYSNPNPIGGFKVRVGKVYLFTYYDGDNYIDFFEVTTYNTRTLKVRHVEGSMWDRFEQYLNEGKYGEAKIEGMMP